MFPPTLKIFSFFKMKRVTPDLLHKFDLEKAEVTLAFAWLLIRGKGKVDATMPVLYQAKYPTQIFLSHTSLVFTLSVFFTQFSELLFFSLPIFIHSLPKSKSCCHRTSPFLLHFFSFFLFSSFKYIFFTLQNSSSETGDLIMNNNIKYICWWFWTHAGPQK